VAREMERKWERKRMQGKGEGWKGMEENVPEINSWLRP